MLRADVKSHRGGQRGNGGGDCEPCSCQKRCAYVALDGIFTLEEEQKWHWRIFFLLYYRLCLERASKHRGTQRLAVGWRPRWWRQTVFTLVGLKAQSTFQHGIINSRSVPPNNQKEDYYTDGLLHTQRHETRTDCSAGNYRRRARQSDVDASELSPLISGTVATSRLLATSWEI